MERLSDTDGTRLLACGGAWVVVVVDPARGHGRVRFRRGQSDGQFVRNASLVDQECQPGLQVGDRGLSSRSLADSADSGSELGGRAPGAVFVLPDDGIGGLPALTAERAIADLIEIGTDLSLVAGAVRDAVRAGRLVAPERLVSCLDPVAARRKSDGRELAGDLFELAGVSPEGWHRG